MDDSQDNSDVLQYLKDNPDLHQQIIDQKLQQGSIFDSQSNNPAVKQDYQEAKYNASPMGHAINKASSEFNDNIQQGNIPVGFGGVTRVRSGIKLLGEQLGPELANGLRQTAPVVNYGKTIIPQAGENAAQAYARVKGLLK